jgi:two-component system OmpR family response regulator
MTTAPSGAALHRDDGTAPRVLVVDDEQMLTDLLSMALRMEGWQVRTASSGFDALQAVRDFEPDAMLLDVMMPDLDGMAVLHRLRQSGNDVPVLFLTARDAVADRVAGLTAGGDDYVTKPFSLEEVVARVRALMRRAGTAQSDQDDPILRVADLTLNEDSHEVERGGTPVELTATEFELLRYLMRNQRRVVSKAQILDRVWHYDFGGRASVVELYISYLRKKLDHGRTPLIHTIRGVGYMIKAPQ